MPNGQNMRNNAHLGPRRRNMKGRFNRNQHHNQNHSRGNLSQGKRNQGPKNQGPPSRQAENSSNNGCYVCGKHGHIAQMCRYRKRGSVPQANVTEEPIVAMIS